MFIASRGQGHTNQIATSRDMLVAVTDDKICILWRNSAASMISRGRLLRLSLEVQDERSEGRGRKAGVQEFLPATALLTPYTLPCSSLSSSTISAPACSFILCTLPWYNHVSGLVKSQDKAPKMVTAPKITLQHIRKSARGTKRKWKVS